MIIHKSTMGIVDRVWLGTYKKPSMTSALAPYMPQATLKNCNIPESEYDQWWEIDSNGSLARKLRAYYPNCTPLVNDKGMIVDIKLGIDDEVLDSALTQLSTDSTTEDETKGKNKKAKRKGRPKMNLFPGIENFITDFVIPDASAFTGIFEGKETVSEFDKEEYEDED